jgi:hypothetical protein
MTAVNFQVSEVNKPTVRVKYDFQYYVLSISKK